MDLAAEECRRLADLGIPAVLLFGIPETKDASGSEASATGGIVQKACSALKSQIPDLCVITDVCLCEYADHGHCGILSPNGEVDNDLTLHRLAEVAISHAKAGADIVMVKPALAYLDVIRDARDAMDAPLAAYNVSGEYSMVKAAAANGWIDERRAVMEILTGIRRAGADMILTYHAPEVALWLRRGS